MRPGGAQGELVSIVLFSLYVKDMPTQSPHVELALYANHTALEATSDSPPLLVFYLGVISTDKSTGYGTGRVLSTSHSGSVF